MAAYLAQQGLQQMAQLQTILIVAPDTMAQASMQQVISGADFDMVQADSGRQGLDISSEQMPSLVLIHHSVPDIDSIDFCRQLRAMPDGCETPIILMLEKGRIDMVECAYESGFTDVIELPANWQLLCYRFRFMLRASAALRSERQHADEAIQKLAFYDRVTGLPNSMMFREHLSMAMHQAHRNDNRIGLLFLGMDHFKRINDNLGHAAGDALLQEISGRLQQSIRATDLAATERGNHALARLDGDEFTIMLVDIGNAAHISRVARRILDALNEPFLLDGNRVVVTASIGIATYPDDGDDIDTLLKHAEAAMYQVKASGRNGLFFYDAHLRKQSRNRIQLEAELYHALEHDELTLFYQPKVDVDSLNVSGFEALVRWDHPDRGMIPPLDFIGVAEDSGLIIPMGKWVIRTACRQHQAWCQAGFGPIPISVNLSCHQFRDRQLLNAVCEILDETGMNPAYLEFEITESVLMQDADTAMLVLSEMKKMGMKISIDDFGTGYSSMAYLKHFPIDVLKVDRSFIMDIPGDRQEATITSAIIKLAHALGLTVVAEGVENAEQLHFLRQLHCNQIQGYLFSPPVSNEKAEHFINTPFMIDRKS